MPKAIVPIGTGSAKKDPKAVHVDPKAAKKSPSLRAIPPVSAKKAGAVKPLRKPKRVSAKAKPKEPKPKEPKPKEVDPKELDPEEARTRCAEIYRLEKAIEAKRAAHDLAKRAAKSAREALAAAEEALEKEIKEQRFGPGPLFPVQ